MTKIKDSFFGGAEKRAGEVQARASRQAVAEQRRQFAVTQEQLAPFREAGLGALERQQQFLGLLGPEQQAAAFQQFQESPGQAFLRQRGERSLLRGASAIGGLGGGNIREALVQQGIGFAGQQLGEFQNRLADLTGLGQQTALGVGQLGAQAAGQIGQGLEAAGAAKASGILGQAAGFRSGIGQVAQLAGGFGGFGGAGAASPQFVPGSLGGIGAGVF